MRTTTAASLAVLATLLAARPAAAQRIPATIEEVPVWRLQIVIGVGNWANAGVSEDDDDGHTVYVRTSSDARRRVYLDYGGRDFVGGVTRTFDIAGPG